MLVLFSCGELEIPFQDADDYSSDAQFTGFSFRREFNHQEPFNRRLQIDADANIDHENGMITVTLAENPGSDDLDRSRLKASFEGDFFYTMVGSNIQIGGSTINDFNSTVLYRVVAEDNSWKEYKVVLNTRNFPAAPPQAYLVKITGKAKTNSALMGNYFYADQNYDPEGNTILRWLISDSKDGDFKPIANKTGKHYLIKPQNTGKYLKFEVIPKTKDGEKGEAYRSNVLGPVEQSVIKVVPIAALEPGEILISEVLYDTDIAKGFFGATGDVKCSDPNDEFIELYNNSANEVNLKGASIQYGSSSGNFSKKYTFGGFILEPKERVSVVAKDAGCYTSDNLSGGKVLFNGSAFDFSGGGATFALVSDNTDLPDMQGGPAIDVGNIKAVVLDYVGTASSSKVYEGSARAMDCTDTSSQRKESGKAPIDTNDNSSDWGCSAEANGTPGVSKNAPIPKLVIRTPDLTLTEGGSTQDISVFLTSIPSANVMLTLSLPIASHSDLRLNGNTNDITLIFTSRDHMTPQTVSVNAFNDPLNEGTETHSVAYNVESSDTNYNSLKVPNTSITINDNDLGSGDVSHLVIAEIGNKHGNSTNNDYIVLYNPTLSAISLDGKYIGRDARCEIGGGWSEYKPLPDVSIPSHRYYLISRPGNSLGADSTQVGSITTNYCVVLGNSTTRPTSATHASVIDFVAFGSTTTNGEGDVNAPGLSDGNSLRRKGNCFHQDTNNNEDDFDKLDDNMIKPPNSNTAICTPL